MEENYMNQCLLFHLLKDEMDRVWDEVYMPMSNATWSVMERIMGEGV